MFPPLTWMWPGPPKEESPSTAWAACASPDAVRVSDRAAEVTLIAVSDWQENVRTVIPALVVVTFCRVTGTPTVWESACAMRAGSEW